MPNRVVHFEIHANDIERCKTFYAAVFGWKMLKYDLPDGNVYWGIETGPKEEPGINGGIVGRRGLAPEKGAPVFGYVCTLQVEDYDAMEKAILSHGGALALAKFAIPGMAWQGYFTDTEGNIFGIHQPDTDAA